MAKKSRSAAPSSTDPVARWPRTCCCSRSTRRSAPPRCGSKARHAPARGTGGSEAAKVVTIKTIVHVVYNTDEQNISAAQINSQITAMNKDFRATNPDRSADARAVEGPGHRFAHPVQAGQGHAHEDERGPASPTDDGVKKASTGGIAPITPKTHLNFWVCPLTGGLLGYAQFPGGPGATDGVVINYQAFGTSGTAQAPFNKGRTATHEVGHYLNLRHIWGDTPDCSGSDMVADTPNCAGPNFGTPACPRRHVQQRPERRHVRELHGLHRRRGDVHVHRAAGAAHAHRARDARAAGCCRQALGWRATEAIGCSRHGGCTSSRRTRRRARCIDLRTATSRCRGGRASGSKLAADGSATVFTAGPPTTGSSSSRPPGAKDGRRASSSARLTGAELRDRRPIARTAWSSRSAGPPRAMSAAWSCTAHGQEDCYGVDRRCTR